MPEAPFHFYEAVSYTWGDMSNTKRIDLDGHSFSVTHNLHGLLKRLRHKRAPGFYWVDAICINQQDLSERGQQVQLMKAIYEHAKQVLIWLGPASADSDIAMDLIDEITDADSEFDSAESESIVLQRWSAQLQASLENPDDHHKWQALASLFDRPWWRRAWIRQEVAVASDAWVLCGDDRLQSWTTMIQAMEAINRIAADFEPFTKILGGQSSGYHQAIVVDTFRESIEEDGCVTDEEHLLLHGRQCEATDPRDRVFALIGLAGDQARAALVPDYELAEPEVFWMATKYLITSRNSLDILSHCGLGRTDSLLPSWVVDLSTDWSELPLRFREDQETIYGSLISMVPTIIFHELGDTKVLNVKGLYISKVAHTGPGYLEEDDEMVDRLSVTHATTSELLDAWITSMPAPRTLDRLRERLTPWFCTIIAGQDNDGSLATEQYIADNFPVKRERLNNGQLDVELLDQMCQHFCNLSPVYTCHILNRHMFITENGLLGLGPRALVAGDLVCYVYGCGVPLILRSTQDGQYRLVGETYVHSIMDGHVPQEGEPYEEIDINIV